MSSPIRQLSPGRLQVREGGGCLAVFGVPFFGAGIFIMLACLQVIPFSNAREMPWFAWPLLTLMGVAFTAVGGGLVFGRSWTTLDAMHRTVVKQWGLLVPMHETTHRLDDFTAVRLDFKRGDSDSADQYPVALKGRTGADLPLFTSTTYGESRARATAVAELLHLEIEDSSTDHPVRLSAAQANLPLQHRLRIDRQQGVVARPAAMRSEVAASNGSVSIVIPAARTHPALFIVFLIPLVIPFWFLAPFSRFFHETNTPNAVAWVFQAFLIVVFGVLPASAVVTAFLKARRGRITVTASTAGIRIEERRIWKTRTLADLPAADIMDVDYGTTESMMASAKETAGQVRRANPAWKETRVADRTERMVAAIVKFAKGSGVTIKTREGLTTFGQGLEDDEIKYLHFVVRQTLVYGRPLA